IRHPPRSTLFADRTLFRSRPARPLAPAARKPRDSTRLALAPTWPTLARPAPRRPPVTAFRTLKATQPPRSGPCCQYPIPGRSRWLNVKPEMTEVAVLDDVVPAFQAHEPLLPGRLFRAGGHQILVGDDFGPDEAPFEVGVDDPGGLGRLRALPDGPGPHFPFPCCEESDKAQAPETAADDPLQARLLHPQLPEEGLPLLGSQSHEFFLDAGRNDGDGRPFRLGDFHH